MKSARSDSPKNYSEWKAQAIAADSQSGAEKWKTQDRSYLYDYKYIRRRYNLLNSIRSSGDKKRLAYYLNEGLHGNMGNMGAPGLYSKCVFGTKILVTNFVNRIIDVLELLDCANEKEISRDEKIVAFRRISLCFGRSALMLSGGGSLGPFHIGVIKALWDQGLLPNVISGASAGAVMAAVVGTQSSKEMAHVLSEKRYIETFRLMAETENVGQSRKNISLDDLIALIESLVPDMTFHEALEESGLYINVSVAAVELRQQPRLLNAISSANVYIRDALLASCAVPGVFPAVTLAAKSWTGKRKSYSPSRKWVDGSISQDLPARQLARLYGANHFISSQTNPLILWTLQGTLNKMDPWSKFISTYQASTRDWLRAIYPLAVDMVPPWFANNVRMMFDLMTQEYTADITIIPQRRYYPSHQLLVPLTNEDAFDLVNEGEKSTWPRIEQIRNNISIGLKLDEILDKYDIKHQHTARLSG